MSSRSVQALARPWSAWVAPVPTVVTASAAAVAAVSKGHRRGRGPPALSRHVAPLWLTQPRLRRCGSSPLWTPPTSPSAVVSWRSWWPRRVTVTCAGAGASPPPPPAPPPPASGVPPPPVRLPSPPPSGTAAGTVTAVLRDLNDEQVAAVTAPTAAPVMVLAGPGSGKTRVLTARAAYLAAAAGVPLSSMLAVTFTNKAAAEMGERLGRLLAPQGGDPRSSDGVQDGEGFGGNGEGGGGGSDGGRWDSPRQRSPWGVTVATLHSIACRWLRQYGSAIGVPSTYAVLDADDSRRLVSAVVKDAGLDLQVVRPRAVAAAISYAKNVSRLGNDSQDAWLEAIPKSIPQGRALATAYWERCKEAAALDFDDLLLAARWLLWAAPNVRAVLQARYRHVLVDECQDLNVVQYDILRLLASPALQVARGEGDGGGGGGGGGAHPAAPSVFFVGDFDQLLYSWRGARPQHGTAFAADFGTVAAPMARYELSANYRSTGIITAVGSALIAGNPGRDTRAPMRSMRGVSPATPRVVVVPLSDARAEAAFVVARARALVRSGAVPSYASIAVMYRSNVASRALEEALVASGDVPYRLIGGVRFYDRREVRDLCAYLRLALSTADGVAFSRVVNVPPRRIGDKTLADLDAYAATAGVGGTAVGAVHAVRLLVAATEAGEAVPLRKAAVAQLGAFVAVIDHLAAAAAAGATVVDLLDHTITAVGYREYLATASFSNIKGLPAGEARQQRWNNVLELRSVAYKATSLADFLDDVALMANDIPSDTDTADGRSGGAATPRLSLMTLHASKGLEFDAVFLVGLEEGSLPTYSAIVASDAGQIGGLEEERRLAYVGVTRARTRLYMCFKRFRMIVARDGGALGGVIGVGENACEQDGDSGGSRMVMLPCKPSRFLADLAPELVEVADVASGETVREDESTADPSGRRGWELDPANERFGHSALGEGTGGWSSARGRPRKSIAAATGAAMARRVAAQRLPAGAARAARGQPQSSSTGKGAARSVGGGSHRSDGGGGRPRPALAWAEGAFVRCPVRERGLIMRVDEATGEIDIYWMRSASTETIGIDGRQGLTLTR